MSNNNEEQMDQSAGEEQPTSSSSTPSKAASKFEPHSTRSRTLKRDLSAVFKDEDKQKAREILEPILKRARTSLATTNITHPNADDSDEDEDGEGEGEGEAEEEGDAREELEMVFRLFDKNGDGHIDSDELASVLRALGFRPSFQQVGAIMKEGDEDGNGTLELDEFVSMMSRLKRVVKAEEAQEKKRQEIEDAKEKERRKKEKEKDKEKKDKAKAAKPKTPKPVKQPKPRAVPKQHAIARPASAASSAAASSAPSPLRRQLKRGDSVLQLRRTDNILKLNRGLSISDFYTNFAGKHGTESGVPLSGQQRDKYNNLEGREFDLGREGAFGRFGVLVGLFCLELTEKVFMEGPGLALQQKGFRVICTNDENEFADKLAEYDVGFIVSSDILSPATPKLANACLEYHKSGGGLAIWADNAPFFATANAILAKVSPGFTLTGDTPGDNNLTLAGRKADAPGTFSRHLITSGVQTLYEGVTICYPANNKDLTVIANSTDRHPCMLCADYDILTDDQGRLAIDCGFTKLGYKWDTAGTGRYVRNLCVWLLGLEHRMRIGASLQGKIDLKAIKAKLASAAEGESEHAAATTTTTTPAAATTTTTTEGEGEGKGKEPDVDNVEEEEEEKKTSTTADVEEEGN